MENNLPETVFVHKMFDAHDDRYSWLSAEETLVGCATQDEVRIVGVYKLVEVKRITLKVTEEVVEE